MTDVVAIDVHATIRGTHLLPAHQDRALPELLAAGRYDRSSRWIVEGLVPLCHPLHTRHDPYRLYLFAFGMPVRVSVVERKFAERRLRLADLLDLLLLGATYREAQLRAPIAGLGTRWDGAGCGEIYAPSLDGLDGTRSVNLDMVSDDREFHDLWLFGATDLQD